MQIPGHLKKFVVPQDDSFYSASDQAVWRFCLKHLTRFLSEHAHPSYLSGLQKTGISLDGIPQISEISKHLEDFGWQAAPVSGFIPPTVFMEMQALKILPIARDMRSLEHLNYTPAPDIVHEAAGHAPMLAFAPFREYLTNYAQLARKALGNAHDLKTYKAVRELSDLKENPSATKTQVDQAQAQVDLLARTPHQASEAALLARMNWWTAEYGLIGDLKNPKIFGAGLLSSLKESRSCLLPSVRKLPMSLDCLSVTYDITETQPQLFVTPDFETLSDCLKQFSESMAYKVGGLRSLLLAKDSQALVTIELNSGLQISGHLESYRELDFIKFTGACQLSIKDQQLSQQGPAHHPEGFSSPLGRWKSKPERCPSTFTESELESLGLKIGKRCRIEFVSQATVEGELISSTFKNGKLILLSWNNCSSLGFGQVLYKPEWGRFDMAVGSEVISSFAGPADRASFDEIALLTQTEAPKINQPTSSVSLNKSDINQFLEAIQKFKTRIFSEAELLELSKLSQNNFPSHWLPLFELLEIATVNNSNQIANLKSRMQAIAKTDSSASESIDLCLNENGI